MAKTMAKTFKEFKTFRKDEVGKFIVWEEMMDDTEIKEEFHLHIETIEGSGEVEVYKTFKEAKKAADNYPKETTYGEFISELFIEPVKIKKEIYTIAYQISREKKND